MRRKRIFFAVFVARMEGTRLPKLMMFGDLVGARAAFGARINSGWDVSWNLRGFGTYADQWAIAV